VPVAQSFEVAFVPGLKPAPDADWVSSATALNTNSPACVVVAVAVLDTDALAPAPTAVRSSGEAARPDTEKACIRCCWLPFPPVQVTVIVEPAGSCDATAGAEQMIVKENPPPPP
jgi:hypothetical protein